MNRNQKPTLILILILSIIGLIIISYINTTLVTKNSVQIYGVALENYKNNKYKTAYKEFGKVSSFSTLKPAAMFRQAKCLEQSGHRQRAILQYSILALRYPNFQLIPKAKYNSAKLSYTIGKYHKAKGKFKQITNKYSESEYAIASEYYLGMIEYHYSKQEKNSTRIIFQQEKALNHFREYLDKAAGGRYAQQSINKIKEIQNNKISRDDAYLIAKSYTALYDNKTAGNYYEKTNIPKTWVDIVKNNYELNDYPQVRTYTEKGLKEYSYFVEAKDVHKAIDLYLTTTNQKSLAIQHLLSINNKANGYDYLLYLNCKNSPKSTQNICYTNIYNNYPNGQFSADALFNIFYDAIRKGNYQYAKQLGEEHLKYYPNTNSTPAVMYWLAKTNEKLKYYNTAQSYYKKILKEYPDDYYAYQAFLKSKHINQLILKTDIEEKQVMFPYKMNAKNDMIVKLAIVGDYALLQDICEKDKFIKSWIEYQKGEYSKSTVIARDAMAELKEKPDENDLRWRLVYPIHYYNEIKRYAGQNNPVIILSLVREESYFNPNARSSVGAKGLMQLMPETANDIASRYGMHNFNLDNPNDNLQIGNWYYSYLKNILHNDFYVILSYNGGFNAVNRWKENFEYNSKSDFLEQVPYEETQNYLKKVLRSYWNYVRLY